MFCCGWLCFCDADNNSVSDGNSEDNELLFKKKEEDYIAIYDFIPLLELELEVRNGDPIKIIEEEIEYSQWCNATNKRTGNTGLIPTTYLTKSSSLEKESWYFSDTNRAAAETLLLWDDNEVGTFLVRPSTKDPNSPYILSLRSQDDDGTAIVKHYKIYFEIYSFFIIKEFTRTSLPSLIDCYLCDKDNILELSCPLTIPCKKSKPLLPNFGPRVRNFEIGRTEIVINDDTYICGGNFSDVHKCKLNNIEVTVITRRNNLENSMEEIKILRSFKHKQIVSFYGACTEKQPYLIILEYLPNGDLEEYVKQNKLLIFQKLYIISQIVSGMKYLESKNVVHRDLAARNILVGDRLMAKISDFEISRILNSNGEYMRNSIDTYVPFPIKWSAFECFYEFEFTSKSDVWSFGILLMEIFTDGNIYGWKTTLCRFSQK